ncbi:hypothetical protein MTR_2g451360 [Medicago truncatula]|uniref:Uncharacterized protein n=1 Tax=Medicago truncatula TaxID=3880 RepID=A0A072V9A2_MEDTR|nr:hypothetical protein MTR_2g451360 [Medicago truncatula]
MVQSLLNLPLLDFKYPLTLNHHSNQTCNGSCFSILQIIKEGRKHPFATVTPHSCLIPTKDLEIIRQAFAVVNDPYDKAFLPLSAEEVEEITHQTEFL